MAIGKRLFSNPLYRAAAFTSTQLRFSAVRRNAVTRRLWSSEANRCKGPHALALRAGIFAYRWPSSGPAIFGTLIFSRRMASVHPNAQSVSEAQALMTEGQRLLEMGSTALAMDAYQRSLQLYPTSTAYYNMGNIYFQMDERQDAKKCWEKSLSMDPGQADVHVNLGNLEFLEQRLESAIEHYITALGLEEDHEVRLNLAMAYDKLQRLDEAIQNYNLIEAHLGQDSSLAQAAEFAEHVSKLKRNAMIRRKTED